MRRVRLLLTLSALAACQGEPAPERAPAPAPAPPRAQEPAAAAAAAPAPAAAPLRYLALGDSYTIGEGVPAGERWPEQLAALLRAEGLELAPPVIVARTGWTTDELLAGLEAARPEGPFQLVTLLIGVNDQYRGRPPERLREGLRRLIPRAVELAGGRPERVLLVSIPDWGASAFGRGADRAAIARSIDACNAVVRSEAEAVGVGCLDVTALSRQAGEDPQHLVGDGLHPSGRAYAEWARAILPAARAALAGPAPSSTGPGTGGR